MDDHTSTDTETSAGLKFDELLSDPHNYRGDLRLLERAVRNDWEIPPENRSILIKKLDDIICSKLLPPRVTVRAGNVLADRVWSASQWLLRREQRTILLSSSHSGVQQDQPTLMKAEL